MVKFKVKAKDCQLIVKAKLSLGEKLDEKELNNFSRKYIRGMLKTKKIKKNIVEYLGPISISLYDWCKKPISKYEFFFVMEQIVDLSQRMIVEELNINHVILDMKNIYINKQTKELQFIYLPLLRSEGINNIVELMYNIIYSVTPMQEIEGTKMNKEIIMQQYKKINKEADDIRELSTCISQMGEQMGAHWRGLETETVFRQLGEISYALKKINKDMVEFGHEYLKLTESMDD